MRAMTTRARFRCCVRDRVRARGLRSLALLAVSVAVLASAGCRSGACTDIGCAPEGITVQLPALAVAEASDELTVDACVGDRCTETSVPAAAFASGATVTTPELREGDVSFRRATVSVAVTDPSDGRVLFEEHSRARVTTSHPNGRGCPPACVSGEDVRLGE
jgi:hypothetical protein